MKNLSKCLTPKLMEALGEKIRAGAFPGLRFESAMQFILTNGILPEDGLPVQSFLKLEDWLISESKKSGIRYSATELKNKTGEILEQVLKGNVVELHKHGRLIARITPVEG